MIVYGRNERKMKQEVVQEKCSNCESEELVIQVNQKYAHVYGIPLFPYGKGTYSVCPNCQNTLELNQMDGGLHETASRVKASTPFAAIWSFAGIGIIGIIIAIASYMNMQDFKKEDAMLASPEFGDVFVFKTKSEEGEVSIDDDGDTVPVKANITEYFFGKIIERRGDSADFVYSNYYFYGDAPSKSDYLENVDNYDDFYDDSTYYSIHIDELVELHHEKSITDVYRFK